MLICYYQLTCNYSWCWFTSYLLMLRKKGLLWKYLEVFAPNDLFLFVLFLLFFTTFSYHEIVKKKYRCTYGFALYHNILWRCSCFVIHIVSLVPSRYTNLRCRQIFFFLCVFSLTLLVSCSSLSGSSLSDAAVVFYPGVKHSRRRISFYSSSCNVN